MPGDGYLFIQHLETLFDREKLPPICRNESLLGEASIGIIKTKESLGWGRAEKSERGAQKNFGRVQPRPMPSLTTLIPQYRSKDG